MRGSATIIFGEPARPTASGSVTANVEGFNYISVLHKQLSELKDTDIIVDFSRISWIDGHLTASLDTVFRQSATNSNIIKLSGLQPRLRETLCKNRLLAERKPDQFNTVMPITPFSVEAGQDFSSYAKKYLDRPEMPKMTRSLRRRFFEGVDELFANAALHSRTNVPIMVGGQFFPRAGKLAFCIADGGEGMHQPVCAKLRKMLHPEEAIAWAMEPYNTTRQGDIPGGLGSKILREFIELNKGKITVVSNNGFWGQHRSRIVKRRLANPFPGTVVLLEVNTSDTQSYDLANAPDPHSIW